MTRAPTLRRFAFPRRHQWEVVLLLSFPVILVDEGLKAVARRMKAKGNSSLSLSELVPLRSIEIVGGNPKSH